MTRLAFTFIGEAVGFKIQFLARFQSVTLRQTLLSITDNIPLEGQGKCSDVMRLSTDSEHCQLFGGLTTQVIVILIRPRVLTVESGI